MNIAFHNSGIHSKFGAIFQAVLDSGLDDGFIDLFHCCESQSVECLIEGIMFGHAPTVKTRGVA
jgi:hypothetical protein